MTTPGPAPKPTPKPIPRCPTCLKPWIAGARTHCTGQRLAQSCTWYVCPCGTTYNSTQPADHFTGPAQTQA